MSQVLRSIIMLQIEPGDEVTTVDFFKQERESVFFLFVFLGTEGRRLLRATPILLPSKLIFCDLICIPVNSRPTTNWAMVQMSCQILRFECSVSPMP